MHKPDYTMERMFTLKSDPIAGDFREVTVEELLEMGDGEVGCFVADQGWETYMVAAQGLPVIELIEDYRQVQWLSKWSNPYYRAIELQRVDSLLSATLENVRGVLRWQFEKAQAVAANKMQTDHSTSSALVAASTSDPAR
jgi:hypothetical protein